MNSVVLWFKSIEICSEGSNWQYVSIDWDKGLAQTKLLAITWANEGLFYWCIYASLCLSELRIKCNVHKILYCDVIIAFNILWYIIKIYIFI